MRNTRLVTFSHSLTALAIPLEAGFGEIQGARKHRFGCSARRAVSIEPAARRRFERCVICGHSRAAFNTQIPLGDAGVHLERGKSILITQQRARACLHA